MNIIAIMGPHGVFYKDEPIKELESALVAQGFQIIWPQNSVDLLKFIEHNPRICGVIFDWDEYSLDLCSDINQLNEYLPLYAFINTHSTMDVSVQDMRMALWFFEYALGQAEDIAIRMRQYTDEYLDNITPPFTKALFTYVKERKYTFCTPGHMGGTAYQKSPVGCLFYDFFGGNTVVVKFFWTRRSDGRVMHRRATGRQGWPAFRTVRVIGSQVLNAIGYCYKS